MRKGWLALLAVGLGVMLVAAAFGRTAGQPTSSGPLTLTGGSCKTPTNCALDYVLDPSVTSDPTDSWHGLWTSTATSAVRSGWCDLDAIATLEWGNTGPAGSLPTATYPRAGSSEVGPKAAAALTVDAGGKATTPGRVQGHGGPAGLITAWVHRGYMVALWQGRATVDPALVLAAAVRNPTSQPTTPPEGANDYTVGLPCRDYAPPGTTFLARFAHATIRTGQTAYLELRIPDTGLRWTITPTLDEQTAVDGTATVQLTGGLGGLTTKTKPQTLRFADRWTFETRPGFGTWTAIVTLHGPTGVRHYRVPLTVKA